MRITFTKEGPLRYIGHLDLVRMWERAFRRAKLPLAYTLGFTPHPRLTFAAPLALGATSEAELLDIYLRETMGADELSARLTRQLPGGCVVRSAIPLPVEGQTIAALTRWASYAVTATEAAFDTRHGEAEAGSEHRGQGSRWASGGATHAGGETPKASERDGGGEAGEPREVPWRPADERLPLPEAGPALPSAQEIEARIDRFLSSASAPHLRARDGKVVDVRPFVLGLKMVPERDRSEIAGSAVRLEMVVRMDASGSGRPDEIAAALGLRATSVHRRAIGLEGDPIPV